VQGRLALCQIATKVQAGLIEGGRQRRGVDDFRQAVRIGAANSGLGLDADRSVLKRNADEIALPPDHAALANGMKIVEAQFEIQRQQIEGVEFDSSPGIRDVLNAASEDTALRVKEQPRVFRNRRPRNRSAFAFHRSFQQFEPGPWQAEASELRSGGNQVRSSS